MTIESTYYDTQPGTGVTEVEWSKSHPDVGSSEYGVVGAGDFKLTAHPTTPYAVNLAPGQAWGQGVYDESDATVTVTSPTPAAGTTRWDLICARRDWQPVAGGPTSFVSVQGGASKQIPAGRANTPGTLDDQPLWLVEWKAGQNQPNAIVDLRVWAGNGGALAKDLLVREYLKRLGTQVKIGKTTWRYEFGLNDIPEWTSDATDVKNISLAGGYAALGAGYSAPLTRKHADGRVYLGGAIGAAGATVNVDKTAPTRFKVGEVTPGHAPESLEAFEVTATASMGKVFIYVYPVGHAKAGWVEFETTLAPGHVAKSAFSILLTGGFNWAAA